MCLQHIATNKIGDSLHSLIDHMNYRNNVRDMYSAYEICRFGSEFFN